ncbi:hypothetical protein [Microbacterium sp. PA5]|uniref:hypothetical protein n=1 Tax=Microbacterium sp. PA5 TaxID=3416654 RepID=UPI003CEC6375
MTVRTSTAVIVKATTHSHDGETATTYYGPFLPHVGSATTSFIAKLEHELEESGRYRDWDTSIETVFIAGDESDCEVRATR